MCSSLAFHSRAVSITAVHSHEVFSLQGRFILLPFLNRIILFEGWHKGESTHLPPIWPGFDSQTLWCWFSILLREVFLQVLPCFPGRHADLMVSALDSGSSSLGSGPGWGPCRGHCVVFLGKTLYSHGVFLHPGVEMGVGEFNAGGNPVMD